MFRISGIANDSIVDGPGIRLAIFTQGCPHNCKGCHNPQTHDFSGGSEMETMEILDKIKANPLLDGITLTGGEPFSQAKELVELAKKSKEMGMNVLAYSGYTFEELSENEEQRELLECCDVLIDGPFIEEQRSLELRFKGSKNQRIIDVQQSLSKGCVVIKEY